MSVEKTAQGTTIPAPNKESDQASQRDCLVIVSTKDHQSLYRNAFFGFSIQYLRPQTKKAAVKLHDVSGILRVIHYN